MAATIMCALLTIAFTFDADGIQWLLAGTETIAWVWAAAALLFGTLWFRHPKTTGAKK